MIPDLLYTLWLKQGDRTAEQIVEIDSNVRIELEQMASPEIIEHLRAYLIDILQVDRDELD